MIIYQCDKCTQVFSSMHSLLEHIKEKHKDILDTAALFIERVAGS